MTQDNTGRVEREPQIKQGARIAGLERAKTLLDLARYSYQNVTEQHEYHWRRFRDMVTVYLACSGVLFFLSKSLRGIEDAGQLMLVCIVISWIASAVALGMLVSIFLGDKFKYPPAADEIRTMIREWEKYFDSGLYFEEQGIRIPHDLKEGRPPDSYSDLPNVAVEALIMGIEDQANTLFSAAQHNETKISGRTQKMYEARFALVAFIMMILVTSFVWLVTDPEKSEKSQVTSMAAEKEPRKPPPPTQPGERQDSPDKRVEGGEQSPPPPPPRQTIPREVWDTPD